METATREIMWNVQGKANVILMYTLFTIALIIMLKGLRLYFNIINQGKGRFSFANFWEKLDQFFKWVVFQSGVSQKSVIGVAHLLIFYGFIVLFITTTVVFIHHDLGIKIYQGYFYLFLTVASDIFGLGVIIGCLLAGYRRYVERYDYLHNKFADAYLLVMLGVLSLQGFIVEGLRIAATDDPWRLYSIVGNLFAMFFWQLEKESILQLHFIFWWFHCITAFIFIAFLPYSKFLHSISSAVNLFFNPKDKTTAMKFPGDIEELIEREDDISFGQENSNDFLKDDLLRLMACTSCGRCQEVCPAYSSGKPLSPKWMVLDLRNHTLLAKSKELFGNSSNSKKPLENRLTEWFIAESCDLRKENESYLPSNNKTRGVNSKVVESVISLGKSSNDKISGEVLDSDVFWSCTTCMACVEACPVGVDQLQFILEQRRNMVLMHGEVPSEAQNTLRALENRGTPFGSAEDREIWIKDLDVPILKEGDRVDYLYWVGCITSSDPRKQKIAKSLVKIFKRANISFGVLGKLESCTGDPARRIGEENLFQMLAKKNIELLTKINFKAIVTNCPHCLHSFLNEYKDLGFNIQDDVEILHHSALIKELLDKERIKLNSKLEGKVTYHDPCYLGRYNGQYSAPRNALQRASSPFNIIEMPRNKENSFCCGAGGGHYFMDLKVGERVNVLRVNEAKESGADKIATACPFCMQMLEDGVKLTNNEEDIIVKDIAEIVADALIE